MSKKENLQKAIALSLLLTSVYGTPAFAAGKGADGADKNEPVAVTDSTYTATYTGNDGSDGATNSGESGGNGGGTFVELTGSENVGNGIAYSAAGGTGGVGQYAGDWTRRTYGGDGGDGGEAVVNLTVSGAGVTHQNVTLTATGGNGVVGGRGDVGGSSSSVSSDEQGSNGGDGGEG